MVSAGTMTVQRWFRAARRLSLRNFLLILLAVAIIWGVWRPQAFLSLWLSADQQAYLYYRSQDYERAADHFEDRRWRGFSHYQNQNFEQAALAWESEDSTPLVFARANALAHDGEYVEARNLYRALLERLPDNAAVQNNLAIIEPLANEQVQNNRKAGKNTALRMDEEQTAEPESEEEQLAMPKKLLTDEMWLEQVKANPALFLQKKFLLEYDTNRTSGEAE
ncbi:MAG: tetratricopeptide repeat protein [Desulfuromonadales bacterium]